MQRFDRGAQVIVKNGLENKNSLRFLLLSVYVYIIIDFISLLHSLILILLFFVLPFRYSREQLFSPEESVIFLFIIKHIIEKDFLSFDPLLASSQTKIECIEDSVDNVDDKSIISQGNVRNNRTVVDSLNYLQLYLLNFSVDFIPQR